MKKKRIFSIAVVALFILVAIGAIAILIINGHVKSVGKSHLLDPENLTDLNDVDCIIVLGCQVRSDGSLSHMLEDRLLKGLELYQVDTALKLLMSGDHGQTDYDEVNAMKQFALDHGVPSEHVFMDHAGFSTYESMYRAKEIFKAKKVVVVTQEYHLYRALYIAEQLGVEAYGVPADLRVYRGQIKRDIREVLARCKDYVKCLLKSEPTYLGEEISLKENGDITNG